MKKLLFLLLFVFFADSFAQNLQIHYDLGKDREYFTTTLEMFRPDEYGSTFFFVDMDYNRGGNNSVSLAYWEIARYINLPFAGKLSATVQYNDGMLHIKGTPIDVPLGHIWLGGFNHPINLGFVTLGQDFLLRKDYLSKNSVDVQLTTTWFVPFFDGKLSFTGFLDIWSTKQAVDINKDESKIVVLSEPQLWYSFDKHLSVGSELEISSNFIPGESDIQVMPTLGVKWNF